MKPRTTHARVEDLNAATASVRAAAQEVCDASTRLCRAIEKSNGAIKSALRKQEGLPYNALFTPEKL